MHKTTKLKEQLLKNDDSNTVTKSNILATIGLCIKNNENTIENAIRSIMNQNVPLDQLELIVVDESNDKTLEIIKRYVNGSHLQAKIYHNICKGLGPARNFVVQKALGEYIVWVDGDTKLPPNHIKKQVQFMQGHPKVGAAKARYGFIESAKPVALLENSRAINIMQAPSKLVGTSGSIYRTQAIKTAGGFDSNIKGAGEDTEALSRLRKNGWLLSTSDAVYFEIYKETWKRLWIEYRWWGFGAHYVRHRDKRDLSVVARLPPVAFLIGVAKFFPLFKQSRRLICVLLPLHSVFKESAWLSGFFQAHISGYGT